MLFHFLNLQTKSITAAAWILVLSALISRFLGLIREGLLAGTFGAGSELDIYFVAFRIPDLIYNVLIAGGIIVAFLPMFSEYFSKDKEQAWQFTNNILNVFLFLIIFLCSAFFIFTPFLIKLIAPGFSAEQLVQAIFLTRLMFLSPILFGLSSIFSGILQHFNRFLIYSLSPIFYNLGIIFGILFLAPGLGILGVVIGVILGAFLHLVIQIPSAFACGFRYKPIFNFKDPGIKKVFILMFPRIFGMAANQINLIIITAIASTLTIGSIAIFNFASNLHYFPVGIVGVSFAIAAFPSFSRYLAKGQKQEFIKNFSSVFKQILYLTIPASILIFILRNQIVEIILKRGKFSPVSAEITAACLGLFCLGIFAYSLIPLIFRAFFALKDTKTPTLIAVSCIVVNIILSFYFVWVLNFPNVFQNFIIQIMALRAIENIQVLGLPLAFSLAGIFQFVLLMIFLDRKFRKSNIKLERERKEH